MDGNFNMEFIGIVLATILSIIGIAVGILQYLKKERTSKKKTQSISIGSDSGSIQNITQIQAVENSNISINSPSQTINYPPSTLPEKIYRTHPLPEEIKTEMEKLTPFQRIDFAKSYVDVGVEWNLHLIALLIREDGICDLILHSTDDKVTVFCRSNINDYPEIKLLNDGEDVSVRGVIKGINPPRDIYLEECKLVFAK